MTPAFARFPTRIPRIAREGTNPIFLAEMPSFVTDVIFLDFKEL